MAVGFAKLGHDSGHYKQGDVVIFDGLNKSHPEGHMAMYDGKIWISDFKQHDIYPGSGFKSVKHKIYRH
jgi:hypothetical protein